MLGAVLKSMENKSLCKFSKITEGLSYFYSKFRKIGTMFHLIGQFDAFITILREQATCLNKSISLLTDYDRDFTNFQKSV